MKITPGESPGANERTIRTAGTNRLQHRIRFMEGLNHGTKIVNIPNNRPLCRIKSQDAGPKQFRDATFTDL